MDTTRLKELAGIQLNERMPGFGDGFGASRSKESKVIDIVLSNLRTMSIALNQGNMEGVQEELNKAMSMLSKAKVGHNNMGGSKVQS